MNDDVAYGIEADPSDPWLVAAGELTPDKSLARIAGNARFTVATVAVVGTLLTSLGLATATELARSELSLGFALAAVVAAALAVVVALCYLVVRLERLNISDLEQVRLWYLSQLRRTWLPAMAGWLLVVAVVLGATAGAIAVISIHGHEPQLSLSITGTGPDRTLIAHASLTGLVPWNTSSSRGHREVRKRTGNYLV